MENDLQTNPEIEVVADKESNGYKKRVSVLINRNFALLWSGQAISILGDFVFNTTLVVRKRLPISLAMPASATPG